MQDSTPKKSTNKLIAILVSLIVLIAILAVLFIILKANTQSGNTPPKDVENQITYGHDGKYFTTTDTFDDTVKNAAKSFVLFRIDDDEREITEIDQYLEDRSTGKTHAGVVAKDANGYNLFYITAKQTESNQSAPRITISCPYNKYSNNDIHEFSLDGHSFTCLRTVRKDLEKIFGTIYFNSDPSFGSSSAIKAYKNHRLDIYFMGTSLYGFDISPLTAEDKQEAENQDLRRFKYESDYIELAFSKNSDTKYHYSGEFGWDLVNIVGNSCEIKLLDSSYAAKEKIVNLYSFLNQDYEDGKIAIGVKCPEGESEKYFRIFGYAEPGKQIKKYKDLSSYIQLSVLYGFTSSVYVDNYRLTPLDKMTGDRSFKVELDYRETVDIIDRQNAYGYKIKDFILVAQDSKNGLTEITLYKDNYFDKQ